MQILGPFEELTLHSILQLENATYGVPLRLHMEKTVKRPISIGALYITLDRLEEKGFITSHRSEPTKERGGRSKRMVSVTGEGILALNEQERWDKQLRTATAALRPVGGVA